MQQTTNPNSTPFLSVNDEFLNLRRTRTLMAPQTEDQDAEVARNLVEEEIAFQLATNIQAAHRLAADQAAQQQEIAVEDGEQNIENQGRVAGAWADANASLPLSPQVTQTAAAGAAPAIKNDAAQAQADKVHLNARTLATSEPIAHQKCLLCGRGDRLTDIPDLGVLCFTCIIHNQGAELERLAFGYVDVRYK